MTRRASYQHGTIQRVPRAKGPDVWVFRYYKHHHDGDRERKSQIIGDVKQFPTKAAVEKEARRIRKDVNEQELVVHFSDLAEKFIAEDLPTRPHTRKTYLANLVHIRAKWDKARLEDMCKDVMSIQLWLNSFKGPDGRDYAKQTRLHVRNLLHKMFDDAMLWGFLTIQRNPIDLVRIKAGARPKERKLVLTAEQIGRLLDDLETPEHVRVIVRVLACTGMRISEVLGLKWTAVNFDKKTLSIIRTADGKHENQTKSDESEEEEYPMHDLLAEPLKKWKEAVAPLGEWVFSSPVTGRPFHQSTLCADHLKPALKRAGIDGGGWHTFRHTYRATLADMGEELEVQQALMRHSDPSMTLQYGRFSAKRQSKLRKANERLVLQVVSNRTPENEVVEEVV